MITIPVGDFRLEVEEKKAINDVLDSGRISEGRKTKEFETKWSEYIGTKYSVALNSGTSALIAGITAMTYHEKLNVNIGSSVITTPLTYVATSNAIIKTGFNPIYLDVDIESFCITPENIKEYLENIDDISQHSFILPVHLMGNSCDMNSINKIAKKYGLPVVEDSAQAHGTLYHGKKTGSLSLMGCFSFYIAHNIQAGEMGAITTDDKEMGRLVRKIKANGRMCDCLVCTRQQGRCPQMSSENDDDFDPRFAHDLIGYNFKTMEFQSALAVTQIEKANKIIKKRSENVKYLNEALIEFSDLLQLPKFDESVSYLAYPIVIKDQNKISRKKIRIELEKRGIETRPLFGCIPTQQPAYSNFKKEYKGKLPNAEYLGENAFYIGCHQYLSQLDLDNIIAAFRNILGKWPL